MRNLIDGEVKKQLAIQIALEANQVKSINLIIDYCVQYQNHYAFAFLFEGSLIKLIEKGIRVAPLLESDIFCHVFEADDWPLIHQNNEF